MIPVYARHPDSTEAGRKDKEEVDQFARNSALAENAGTVRSDLTQGGDLSLVPNTEKIILAGHGSIGSLNGYSGSELARILVTKWGLRQDYRGNIIVNSCKAGNSTWLWSSLVDELSNDLFGFQANVIGLKGNVVTTNASSPNPGLMRSLGSDAAFEDYKRLVEQYRVETAAKARRIREATSGPDLRKMSAATELMAIASRKFVPQQNTVFLAVTGVYNYLSGAEEKEALKKAQLEETVRAADLEIARITNAIETQFNIDNFQLLQEINTAGVPFGDPTVTVQKGPADRATLTNLWVDFLLRESQVVLTPAIDIENPAVHTV